MIIDPASTKNGIYKSEKENDGSFKMLFNYTFDHKDVLRITDTEGKAILYSEDFRFFPKPNHYYSVGAYIKPSMTDFSATIQVKLSFEKSLSGQAAIARDEKFILNSLERYHEFCLLYTSPSPRD